MRRGREREMLKKKRKNVGTETSSDCKRCAILLNDYLKSVLSLYVVGLLRLSNVYFMNYIRIYCTSTSDFSFFFWIFEYAVGNTNQHVYNSVWTGGVKDNVCVYKKRAAIHAESHWRGVSCAMLWLFLFHLPPSLLTLKIKWYMMHGSLFDSHYFFYSHWTHLINHTIVLTELDSLHERPIRTFVHIVHSTRSGESVHWDWLLNDLRWPTQNTTRDKLDEREMNMNWLALHRIVPHFIALNCIWLIDRLIRKRIVTEKLPDAKFPLTHQKHHQRSLWICLTQKKERLKI